MGSHYWVVEILCLMIALLQCCTAILAAMILQVGLYRGAQGLERRVLILSKCANVCRL